MNNMRVYSLRFATLVLLLSILALAWGCGLEGSAGPAPAEPQGTEGLVIKVSEVDQSTADEIVYKYVTEYFSSLQREGEPAFNLVDAGIAYENLNKSPEQYFLVDLRSRSDFEVAFAAETDLNISAAALAENMDLLPKDKTIYVGCYTGQTAGQVVAALRVAGYDAYSIRGGITNGWIAAGLPVVGAPANTADSAAGGCGG